MAAQLFRDRLDLPGRHALHIHLRERRHQGPLRTLVTLEQLGGEAASPVLRNPQLKLADAGGKGAAVITRTVAEPLRRALALRGTQRLVHLGLEHLLHHRTDHFVKSVWVRKQNVFDGSAGGLTFNLGHGGVPSRESGDVNNHQPAMTALSQRICRTPCTLPWRPSHSIPVHSGHIGYALYRRHG